MDWMHARHTAAPDLLTQTLSEHPPPSRHGAACLYLDGQGDLEYCMEATGQRFGHYIRSIGWDQRDCWFAHCCVVDDGELGALAAGGVGVAHCPSSNLRLASGIAPVRWGSAVRRQCRVARVPCGDSGLHSSCG